MSTDTALPQTKYGGAADMVLLVGSKDGGS